MTTLSRVKLYDSPDMLPGNCSLCGGRQYDGRKWIDFGLSIDWYGVVYLCTLCFAEIEREINQDEGAFPVASFEALKRENELQQQDLVNLKTANSHLEKRNQVLENELAALKLELNTVRRDSSSSSVLGKDKPKDSGPPTRPTPKRRPADVQNDEKPRRNILTIKDSDSNKS